MLHNTRRLVHLARAVEGLHDSEHLWSLLARVKTSRVEFMTATSSFLGTNYR
jgi:hypothetical protein